METRHRGKRHTTQRYTQRHRVRKREKRRQHNARGEVRQHIPAETRAPKEKRQLKKREQTLKGSIRA